MIFFPHLKGSSDSNRCGVFCVKGDTRSLLLLLDNNGAVVVKYKYDAWGKCQTIVAAIEYFRKQRKVIIMLPREV